MRHEDENDGLPDWLWFFISLLGVLGFALLYRRRKEMLSEYGEYDEGAGSWSVGPGTAAPRYVEPDSIPIDVRLEGEALADEEDNAIAAADPAEAALEYEPPITGLRSTGRTPMDEVDRVQNEGVGAAFDAAVEYEPPITQVESTRAQTGGMPERSTEEDDLTVIEGIGPAISALLKGNGITTFRALADAPVDRLDAILEEARLRRIADPGTWAEQARMAAEGRMEDLKTFQQTLKAGRRTNGE